MKSEEMKNIKIKEKEMEKKIETANDINNINWDLLLSFFGKSPKDEDFNRFLLELGIKKHLKGKHKFESLSLTENDSLELSFCSRDYYIDLQTSLSFPVQSEHWYVLSCISVSSAYTGTLPFGLKFDFTKVELEKYLGKAAPGKCQDDDFFYYNKFVLPVNYETEEKNKIHNIQVTMPVKYNISILQDAGIKIMDEKYK